MVSVLSGYQPVASGAFPDPFALLSNLVLSQLSPHLFSVSRMKAVSSHSVSPFRWCEWHRADTRVCLMNSYMMNFWF